MLRLSRSYSSLLWCCQLQMAVTESHDNLSGGVAWCHHTVSGHSSTGKHFRVLFVCTRASRFQLRPATLPPGLLHLCSTVGQRRTTGTTPRATLIEFRRTLSGIHVQRELGVSCTVVFQTASGKMIKVSGKPLEGRLRVRPNLIHLHSRHHNPEPSFSKSGCPTRCTRYKHFVLCSYTTTNDKR